MPSRCFTRPQVRVFGCLVEGAVVRCSAKSRLFHSRRPALSILASYPRCILPISNSTRSYVSTRLKGVPTQGQDVAADAADRVLAEELGKAASVLMTEAPPEENAVQNALGICENLARSLIRPAQLPIMSSEPGKGPTSNLLSLEQESRETTSPHPFEVPLAMSVKSNIADKIAMLAYKIMTDPKVFITPTLLSTYVDTQTILGRPQSFPLIFDLYAAKPAPQRGTIPIKFSESKPNRASSAVPIASAHSALGAAIESKNLSLCLDIIDTTVCTTAYQRNKLLRKALLPATGLALAPVAAYALASQLAQLQQSMDSQMATQMFFVGILAYVGFTATIGIVAITTSNDQMDRITWAKGTPLRDRWLREDERALVDRVAGAWGFQDVTMRGEEEGVDWEALREWTGRRGMVLDNPELMEGME